MISFSRSNFTFKEFMFSWPITSRFTFCNLRFFKISDGFLLWVWSSIFGCDLSDPSGLPLILFLELGLFSGASTGTNGSACAFNSVPPLPGTMKDFALGFNLYFGVCCSVSVLFTGTLCFGSGCNADVCFCGLCHAFREGKLPNSFDDDKYFNVKTMKKIGAV